MIKLSERLSELECQFLKFTVEIETKTIEPIKTLQESVQSLQKVVQNHKIELRLLQQTGSPRSPR